MRASSLELRLLSRLRWPVGRLNTELLGVLRVQPLPAAELHCLKTSDAADGSSAEEVIQNIETNVPTGSTHCHEARPMLVHSVRRVPPPEASSSHRISKSPQLYTSTSGASARFTVVSVML